jgi:predicted ATP-grasp superfamily ATP-dependent carboligase
LPTVLLVGETRGLISRVAWSLPVEFFSRYFVVGPGSLGRLLRLAPRCAGHVRMHLDHRDAAAFTSLAVTLLRSGQTVIAVAADEAGTRFLCHHPVEGLIQAPHPSPAILDDFCDKWRFFAICARLGIRTPNTSTFPHKAAIGHRAVADTFRYPLIVKPVRGTMSKGVVLAHSAAALKAAVVDNRDWNFGPLLVQDFIAGADIQIALFAVDGTVLHHAVQMRNRNGIAFLRNDALLAAARALLRDCGYSGLAHIDARLDRDGAVHMLECNPRAWGSLTAPTWCGLNFVRASVMVALGQVPDCPRSIAGCSAPTPWRRVKAILRNPIAWRRLTSDQKRTLGSAASLALFDVQDGITRIAGRFRRH